MTKLFLGTRDDFGLGADPRLEGFPTYSMMHNDVTGKFLNKFSISTCHINDVINEQQVQNTRQVCSQFCLIKFDFCQNQEFFHLMMMMIAKGKNILEKSTLMM